MALVVPTQWRPVMFTARTSTATGRLPETVPSSLDAVTSRVLVPAVLQTQPLIGSV